VIRCREGATRIDSRNSEQYFWNGGRLAASKLLVRNASQRRELASTGTTVNNTRAMSINRQILDVAIAFGLLEGGLWSAGTVQIAWATAMAAWVAFATIRSRRNRDELGISLSGFYDSVWVIPASLAFAFLMMLVGFYADTLHTLHGVHRPLWHSALYVVWALVQQFLTESFIFVWLESILADGRRAVLVTALLFCLAHIPNPILMATTFAMGLVWSELFRRYRNIYTLAVAHAILGLSLSVTMPEAVTHHMRVGIAYWT
jgi:membrane protease YdiL (CAAX protease family)